MVEESALIHWATQITSRVTGSPKRALAFWPAIVLRPDDPKTQRPHLAPTFIDRRHATRQVPMKVLVLGLSRTGTDSMRRALVQLGLGDVYHGYAAAMENPPDCQLWLDAMAAKWDRSGTPYGRKDWDALLGHCQAVCDVPAVCFAEDLIAAYPEAKVILTNRNIDDWHFSVENALIRPTYNPYAAVLDFFAWASRSPHRFTRPMFMRVFEHYFQNDFRNKGKDIYRQHYARVRAAVSPSNLLEYDVTQGWEPLCAFLNVEVPDGAFPNGNLTVDTHRRIMAMAWVEIQRLVTVILYCITILGLLRFLAVHVYLQRR